MSTPLATLFTKIGFDIDTASLTALHKQIDNIQARMQGLAKALTPNSTSGRASRLAISAQERAAALAEVRQQRLTRLQVRAHEINTTLDKKRERAALAAQLRTLRETSRQAAREMRDARQLADFQNREFNLRQRQAAAVEAVRRKQERDHQAAQLRAARLQSRAAATEMRNTRQLADFQNREFNLRQRNLDRVARQQQADAQRQQVNANRAHTEALRENRRRASERYRQMQTEANFLNREFNLRNRTAERERLRAERQQQIQDRLNNRPPPRPARSGGGGIAGMGINAQTAISGIAGAGFTQQAYEVANFTMSRNPQFEFLTGSAEEAKKQIAFVDGEVKRLSLDMIAANQQYKKMLASGATSIGLEKTQELFTNSSNLATMLGLTEDAQKRMTNAFSQMMSKGQVYSEELKGQLAESLPNAVGIFADALYGNGKAGSGDKAKLFADMDKGKVGLKELTKVIEYMGTLTREDLIAQMLETPAKKLSKLKSQWILTLEQLNDAGFLDLMITALEEVTKLLVKLSNWVKENKADIKEWATLIGGAFKLLIEYLPIILKLWIGFKIYQGIGLLVRILPTIVAWLGRVRAGFQILRTIMMFNPTSLLTLGLVMQRLAGVFARISGFLKASGIVAGFLFIIDLIETLQGKQTLLQDVIDGGGFWGTVGKVILGVGKTIEFVLGLMIAGFDAVFGDGGYAKVVFDKFKSDMLELFPFDDWWESFTSFFSRLGQKLMAFNTAANTSLNPFASSDEAKIAWDNFNKMSITGTPSTSSIRPSSQGGATTNNFSPMLTVHIANGDPITIENTMNDVMNKWATKAAANTSAFSLLRQ